MKKCTWIVALAVALAGCSGESAKGVTPKATETVSYAETPSEVSTSASVPVSPPRSSRGHILKQVGEQGSMVSAATDQPYFTFVVDEIVPGYQCQGNYPPTNKNGQFLAVKTTFTTGLDLSTLTNPPTLHLSEQDWTIIGADGVQEQGTAETFGCAPPTEQWPQSVGPNVTVKATFVLDTRNAGGYLVFMPWFGDGLGWEWQF